MPHRVLSRLATRILLHVQAHPWRLAATLSVLLALSLAVITYAWLDRLDAARQGRIENCRNINELRRQLFVFVIDAELAKPSLAYRLLPDQNCEDLP